MDKLTQLLQQQPTVLADGAMGTRLFDLGLQFGAAPEMWNLEHPQRVQEVHESYLQAGAKILLTNTFGANRFRLALHNLQPRVRELNLAAAAIARSAVEARAPDALVAGDIGPSGGILAPLGDMEYTDAVAGFAEQAAALVEGGVDVIWIETLSALEEMQSAIEGVRQVAPDMPIIATMTFDTHGRTMMGVTPEQAASALPGMGAMAIGGNCGNGPDEILAVIEKMRGVAPQAVLVAKANAGIPRWEAGRSLYGAGPDDMAEYALGVAGAGARIIGACCGSTAEHLKAMAVALQEKEPMARGR
ncbi:MAG TPA: betaine--homocysteine S-methyltransferase [Anaerolineales bacterium]|nr:betaine--homocysteine S-methyltransferase [Anaerolineales bacterium]